MGDEAPPDGNDEGMTHTALSIARPDPVHGRIIDRWLRCTRNMHRDQWLGIW